MRIELHFGNLNPVRIWNLVGLAILLSLFIYPNSTLSAQNVRGTVLEANSNKPLSDVNVYVKETGIGTTTDEKGEFHLRYFTKIKETDTLSFSCIGYESKAVAFSELKSNNFIVLLSESVHLLGGVTITADKKLNLQIACTRLATMKNGLFSFGSVLSGDKIFVIGGDESTKPINQMAPAFRWENYSSHLYVYDIQTNKWATSSLKFSKRAYHNIHFYNDKLYVLGGKTLSPNRKFEYLEDKIEVYDINHNTIFVDNTNPHQTVNFASFVYNDNLIVMGGSTRINTNEEKESTAKVHLLNLKTGYWFELGDMPVAMETKGVIIDSIIYLIGGFDFKPLDGIETYNITTGKWDQVGRLFYGVERPALAFNENNIYIFEDGRIQTYNIVTRELNLYSIDLPLKSCELFCSHNMLYILGGYIDNEISITPSADLYRIDLDEFNKAVVYNTKAL